MDLLVAHDWPGNVRELENAIERATTLCAGDTLRLADLPPSLLVKAGIKADQDLAGESAELPSVPESPHKAGGGVESGPLALDAVKSLKNYIREQEQSYLNRVMEAAGGNKEQAALALGVSLATLYRKLSGDEPEA